MRERKGPVAAKRRWEGEGLLLVDCVSANQKNKTLIPAFSREREKG
jgi:hypothetical protein